MGTKIQISLNLDKDGFLSQECPSCEERFKVEMGEGSEEPISYCPYCDHSGKNCWWTPKQADYLSSKASVEIMGPQLDELVEDLNRSGGGFFRMTAEVSRPPAPSPPKEPDDDWPIIVFDCCGERIKASLARESLFCIICGAETRV